MTFTDLLPEVRALPRPEKVRLLQYLAGELAGAAGDPALDPTVVYPVWSPYGGYEAAGTLLRLLDSERAAP